MPAVMLPWTTELTFMQQSVLITAVRGPDGIRKDHIAKVLLRWYRRCILISAFDKSALPDPYTAGGGSFTGPCNFPSKDNPDIKAALTEYFRHVDELPHHFQLHFMHAAEIIGYKHPDKEIRNWWRVAYIRMVNDLHLMPESESAMDSRLSDRVENWLAAEEVTAK